MISRKCFLTTETPNWNDIFINHQKVGLGPCLDIFENWQMPHIAVSKITWIPMYLISYNVMFYFVLKNSITWFYLYNKSCYRNFSVTKTLLCTEFYNVIFGSHDRPKKKEISITLAKELLYSFSKVGWLGIFNLINFKRFSHANFEK